MRNEVHDATTAIINHVNEVYFYNNIKGPTLGIGKLYMVYVGLSNKTCNAAKAVCRSMQIC